VLLLAGRTALRAQTVPELQGRVRDITGTPIAAALVELVEAGVSAWSNTMGSFRLRAPEAGAFSVRITRIGYSPRTFNVQLDAGRVTTLAAELVPHAVEIDSVVVTARAAERGTTLTRAAIVQSAASTAADAVANVPGVVLIASTPGGPPRFHAGRRGAAGPVCSTGFRSTIPSPAKPIFPHPRRCDRAYHGVARRRLRTLRRGRGGRRDRD
jgi:hypothetical protein